MNNDDHHLFRDEMGDVEPLKVSTATIISGKAEATPGMENRRVAAAGGNSRRRDFLDDEEHIAMIKPNDELSYKRDGVQYGVFKKLRLGKYPMETRLDLHGYTVLDARRMVIEFVGDAIVANIRCVIITHGKGEYRQKPALLKSCVNHWLQQLDNVLAFHSAQRFHGGFGSTYVLLRKSDEKREENKERFSRRPL